MTIRKREDSENKKETPLNLFVEDFKTGQFCNLIA